MKNLNKLSGLLLIGYVIFIFIALIISIKFNITLFTSDINESLIKINLNSTAHITELIFDTTSSILLITASLLLSILFKKKTIALIASLWLIIGGIILAIHNMGNFALTWVAKEYVNSSPFNVETLKTSAFSMLLTAKWGVTIGSFFIIIGTILYNLSILKLSKPIGWFGIFAGLLALISLPLVWVDTKYEMLSYNLYLPMILWQIIFGIWLIRRNVDYNFA
ncbi:MAG: DUF4386 family protein [Bacteroidales bacterium]|nr:DUF4386 family protein [Bacteroidales bacterium]MBN2817391.1 DUF4386 family protein [Bacteroidales bacterium]